MSGYDRESSISPTVVLGNPGGILQHLASQVSGRQICEEMNLYLPWHEAFRDVHQAHSVVRDQ